MLVIATHLDKITSVSLSISSSREGELKLIGSFFGAFAGKNGKTSDTIALTRYSWLDDENLRTSRYARSDLHNRLLACIPENRVKLSKRLSKLTVVPASQSSQNNDTFVELQFEDGSSTEADFVIGADGIRSVSRNSVLYCYSIQHLRAEAKDYPYPRRSDKHLYHITNCPSPEQLLIEISMTGT